MRLIVISGLSGSGKSVALRKLEDLDYYCVDNIPAAMLKGFVSHTLRSHEMRYERVAVGIDARNAAQDIASVPALVAELKSSGLDCRLVFLTAGDSELLRRYAETRRRHPLSLGREGLREAIARERELLDPIAQSAHITIDTSGKGAHDLGEILRLKIGEEGRPRLSILFESFGFKTGLPADSDFVFDARSLPNPYWDAALRPLNGRDAAVAQYLEAHPQVARLLNDIQVFIEARIPEFQSSNRHYMTVAVGCTGGQHRSVYLVERLVQHFASRLPDVAGFHSALAGAQVFLPTRA